MVISTGFTAAAPQVPILIGAYTRAKGEPAPRGIYRVTFDQNCGKFSKLTLAAELI